MEGISLLNVALVIILGIVLLANAVKRTQDTERLFVFRLGRPYRLAGPGIIWITPGIEKGIRVDLNLAAPGWKFLSESKVMDLVLDYLSNEKRP